MAGDFFRAVRWKYPLFAVKIMHLHCRVCHQIAPGRELKKQLCRMRIPAVLACPTRASGLADGLEKDYFAIKIEVKHVYRYNVPFDDFHPAQLISCRPKNLCRKFHWCQAIATSGGFQVAHLQGGMK
jgi:hypothetical protein